MGRSGRKKGTDDRIDRSGRRIGATDAYDSGDSGMNGTRGRKANGPETGHTGVRYRVVSGWRAPLGR